MSHILVIGASKGVGLETVKAALEGGHRVRAFARSAHAIAIEDAGLERMDGDATDANDLARAVAGVDAVALCLGVANPFNPRPVVLFSKATRLLIQAMQQAGVSRLVCVTGLGAGDSRGHGSFLYTRVLFPLVLSRIYEDKDVQEQMIRASSLDWTIVRPGILTNGPATGRARALTDPAQWRDGKVSRADVARFVVGEIEQPNFRGRCPVLIA